MPVDNWKLAIGIDKTIPLDHCDHQLMAVGALGYVPKPCTSDPMPPRKASCCCCSASVASRSDSEEERSTKSLENQNSFPGQLFFLFSPPRGIAGQVFPLIPLIPLHTAAPGAMLHWNCPTLHDPSASSPTSTWCCRYECCS